MIFFGKTTNNILWILPCKDVSVNIRLFGSRGALEFSICVSFFSLVTKIVKKDDEDLGVLGVS